MPDLVDFEALKQRVPIEQVLGMLDIRLKKNGTQLRGKCPICKTNAFCVTPARNSFICFGTCKERGSIIDLVSLVRQLKPAQAAQLIDQHFGAGAPEPTDRSPNHSAGQGKAPGFDAAAYAAKLSTDFPELESLGISPQVLRDWRAGLAPNTSVLKHRLALPLSRAGAIIGYAGLALDDREPKLLFAKELRAEDYIFGEHMITPGPLQLLRDPLDVLRAFDVGLVAVCFLTETINCQQLEMLAVMMHEKECESLEII